MSAIFAVGANCARDREIVPFLRRSELCSRPSISSPCCRSELCSRSSISSPCCRSELCSRSSISSPCCRSELCSRSSISINLQVFISFPLADTQVIVAPLLTFHLNIIIGVHCSKGVLDHCVLFKRVRSCVKCRR